MEHKVHQEYTKNTTALQLNS